jgi:hypothetical protein
LLSLRQSLTLKWPVLHMVRCQRLIPTPGTSASLVWSIAVTLSWKEFNAPPKIQRTSDFHVT